MQTNEQIQHLQQKSKEKPISRREFVSALSIATAAGPGLIAATLSGIALTKSQRAEAAEAVVAALGKLPRRPFNSHMKHMLITPISISQDWNQELYAPALALGINFVHKAGYWGQLPDAFKGLDRESYYTDITVDTTSPGHDPDDYDAAYNQVVQSLQSNGLKYYDIYRAHFGWHSPASFQKGTSYKVFQRLKREGKVRHFGVSQHPYHGPSEIYHDYPQMILPEVQSGIVEAMQVWYSYGTSQAVQDVFAKASEAGVGMTAMKIFSRGGGKMSGDPQMMQNMRAEGKPGRALMRYVLSQKTPHGKPLFNTCVSALGNLQVFEENVGGASLKMALADGHDELVHALEA